MKKITDGCLSSNGQTIRYSIVWSAKARKLRLRVGLRGVEVISPKGRPSGDIESFLKTHEDWISGQLKRIERFRGVRRPQHHGASDILFRGEPTSVRIETGVAHLARNRVTHENACLVIRTGMTPRTPVSRTLENWLRKEARREIEAQLAVVTSRLNRLPRNVYIMGQRTKWGNCSRLQNLSFNWRLIMAPEYVLRYLVTHEAVHLAIPDHSHKFWLTVQSLCPETERAKQWLCSTGRRIQVDLDSVVQGGWSRIAS
jgi:predicted metal-dependent hydrolase